MSYKINQVSKRMYVGSSSYTSSTPLVVVDVTGSGVVTGLSLGQSHGSYILWRLWVDGVQILDGSAMNISNGLNSHGNGLFATNYDADSDDSNQFKLNFTFENSFKLEVYSTNATFYWAFGSISYLLDT